VLYEDRVLFILHFDPYSGDVLPIGCHVRSFLCDVSQEMLQKNLQDVQRGLRILDCVEYLEPELAWVVPMAYRGLIIGNIKIYQDGIHVIPDFMGDLERRLMSHIDPVDIHIRFSYKSAPLLLFCFFQLTAVKVQNIITSKWRRGGMMSSVALWVLAFLLLGVDLKRQDMSREVLEKLKSTQEVISQPTDTAALSEEVEKARKAAEKEVMARSRIEKSMGGELQQFGYDIFPKMPITLTFQNIPVGPDYVIGPADNIVIYMWGNINQVLSLTVDRDGKIILPEAGVVYVWGKKFSEAKELITNALKAHYSGISVEVSLGALRTFPIYVMGKVVNPGIYRITPLINPLQALTLAGGVKKTGSLRRVKILKATGEKIDLDLYRLLVEGDQLENVVLEGGDIIFVPPIGNVAGICGSVMRPAIYELRNKESLIDLVELAGGLLPTAFIYRVQVERVVKGERRSVFDLEFKSVEDFKRKGHDFIIKNGDLVIISTILPGKWNYVAIEGNVYKPGDYELKENWRVKDLIDAALGIKKGTYLENAEIYRYLGKGRRKLITFNLGRLLDGDSTQNIPLEQWDVVRIFSEDEVLPKDSVTVIGAVRRPGAYQILENMTLKDLLFKAGNLLPEAESSNVELYRWVDNHTTRLEKIDLRDPQTLSMPVRRNDIVYVRFKPAYFEMKRVYLGGEVNYPGWYSIRKGETLKDLLERAGGLKEDAFMEGLVFVRKYVKQTELEGNARFISNLRAELLKQSTPVADFTQSEQFPIDWKAYYDYQKELITTLTSIFQLGRILADFKDTINWTIKLEDGDSIYIPPIPHTVQVIGAVCNPGAIQFEEGKDVNYYVQAVGGFTKDADKKAIYVVNSSGFVRKGNLKVNRGETIVVPPKLKTNLRVVARDVTQILSQLAIVLVSIYQLVK